MRVGWLSPRRCGVAAPRRAAPALPGRAGAVDTNSQVTARSTPRAVLPLQPPRCLRSVVAAMLSFGGGVNTSRSCQFGAARRLIGWIAAYAFVLYAVLAGALATQFAVSAHAAFEICLNDIDGVPSPGHTQGQHEDCAIHCATVAGAVPVLALALLQLLFWSRVQLRPRQFIVSRSHEYLRRAGLSRAPPLPA